MSELSKGQLLHCIYVTPSLGPGLSLALNITDNSVENQALDLSLESNLYFNEG